MFSDVNTSVGCHLTRYSIKAAAVALQRGAVI